MDVEVFRRRLIAEQQRLQDGIGRAAERARSAPNARTGDAADQSVAVEQKEDAFGAADREHHLLRQVRDALIRIDQGTYGLCVIDGAPIEPQRLEAVPWAAYCMKHQQARESAHPGSLPGA